MTFKILWLQAGSCGGCTMAALTAEDRGLIAALRAFGVEILWHPALSVETGREAVKILEDITSGKVELDALCVEGSAMRGPGGTGKFQMLSGTGRSMADWIRELSGFARYVVAVGTCSAFGGLPMAGGNVTDACGLQYEGDSEGGLLGRDFKSKGGLPVINIAGCAPHPDWITETLGLLATVRLSADQLDTFARPRFFADHLAHHGCSRNEYYEFKASATQFSHLGCLMENLGCKATQAAGDCNLRSWNGSMGSCPDAGFPCVACTSPGFETPSDAFQETAKRAGIPIGLPVDMPKAWFIALAALSKSATPERVNSNAQSDHVVIPPVRDEDDT